MATSDSPLLLEHFNDLLVSRDSEGIYDIQLCADKDDFQVVHDESAALLVSLFSDRRARADEVADPMKRRGWIGDLVSDVIGDRHGSGIWLYEQRRLTDDVVAGIAAEAQLALQWMVQEGLLLSVSADAEPNRVTRTLTLSITGQVPQGGVFSEAYQLATNTPSGLVIRN